MRDLISKEKYLHLYGTKKFFFDIWMFILSVPNKLYRAVRSLLSYLKKGVSFLLSDVREVLATFRHGDYKTRISYVIMGFGSIARGQILRGLLFLLFEVVFILYMALWGVDWLRKLTFRGLVGAHETLVEIGGVTVPVVEYGDHNLQIMIYGVLTLFFVLSFLYTWRQNVKQNYLAEECERQGIKLSGARDDLRSLVDRNFYKTVLALPLLGIFLFTVVPIIIMVMVAFTNYDHNHTPPANLFSWVGLDNFNMLVLSGGQGSSSFSATFGELLVWTIVWAFFATFSNYFLGMIVAMLINKKGIRLKKAWRTILILTVAVPQFISLLYVSRLFSDEGFVNRALINFSRRLQEMGVLSYLLVERPIPFWTDPTLARVMVVIINIWVGVPYMMLVCTGVLMNIPADLYESARIDGAGAIMQYRKITLPYMLFVTGPYLLTSFIGNMNNFNVIYLLTGGAPFTLTDSAGKTDLLITWLYRLTVTNNDYKLAAVIGIMVFLLVASLSLIVYNIMPSMKNEEEFQ